MGAVTGMANVARWSAGRGVAALFTTLAVSISLLGPGTAQPAAAASSGYWLLGGDGGVFAFGAGFFGAAASDPTRCPANTTDRSEPNGTCWSMAPTPDGQGYWIVNGDTGRVYPYGDAGYFGQPADDFAGVAREFVPNSVAMAATPDGGGYWVLEVGLSGAGRVAHFGDAAYYGDTQMLASQNGAGFNGTPVGLVATPDGHGYWEVHSDGGVFGFGDAAYQGSMGGRSLNAPVAGMAATHDGGGYWLVARDGGVFAFGDAAFAGSMGGRHLNAPMVDIAADPHGAGYWTAGADGGVFSFGGALFEGSMGGQSLHQPVFAIAADPA
jgi:hypothetical protein